MKLKSDLNQEIKQLSLSELINRVWHLSNYYTDKIALQAFELQDKNKALITAIHYSLCEVLNNSNLRCVTHNELEEEILELLQNHRIYPTRPFTAAERIDRGAFVPWKSLKNMIEEFEERVEESDPARRHALATRAFFRALADGELETATPLENCTIFPDRPFVRHNPYLNRPLVIGLGQTCSAPYVVLTYCLLSMLGGPKKRILEGGVGCGYHIACMAELHQSAKLVSCDVRLELCELAGENIAALDISKRKCDLSARIEIVHGNVLDHKRFAKERFDLIYLTFMLPKNYSLKNQLELLENDGILIAPMGNTHSGSLMLYRKMGKKLETTKVADCSFVPAVLPDFQNI